MSEDQNQGHFYKLDYDEVKRRFDELSSAQKEGLQTEFDAIPTENGGQDWSQKIKVLHTKITKATLAKP